MLLGWAVDGGPVRTPAPTPNMVDFSRGGCPHPPAVSCPAKQHGKGQADPVDAAGPNLRRARAQWPGKRGKSHSNFARRKGQTAKGAAKNGVLVPLPPWAKEPAAGAAESSFSCSFQGWKEPKIPGGWLRGVQALQSPAPGPPLRETLPGSISSHPARVVQSIAPASAPLPLARQSAENCTAGPGKRAWCQQP